MEKFDNMKQNLVADDELDQISGGRNLMDAFTAEFRGKAMKPKTLEMRPDAEDDFEITTLEMRADPLLNKETGKSRKIIKL